MQVPPGPVVLGYGRDRVEPLSRSEAVFSFRLDPGEPGMHHRAKASDAVMLVTAPLRAVELLLLISQGKSSPDSGKPSYFLLRDQS